MRSDRHVTQVVRHTGVLNLEGRFLEFLRMGEIRSVLVVCFDPKPRQAADVSSQRV